MGGLVETLEGIRLNPSDYSVITISFDPSDKPEDSKNKKKNFLSSFKKPFPESTWRFLTGTQENINKITDSAGFKYKQEGTEFLHPAGVTVLSPDGKITRYLYGIYFRNRSRGIY
jgi:protein SCO1/2